MTHTPIDAPAWASVVRIHQRGRRRKITGELGDLKTIESGGTSYRGTIERIEDMTVVLRLLAP